LSIFRLVGSTSATKRVMPFSWAAAAMCSSRTRAESPPLVRVLDDESHLGLVLRRAFVPDDADDVVADRRDDRASVDVVHGREAVDVAVAELGVGREEPEVDRLCRQAGVERTQRLGVARDDRTEVGGAAVAQHHVGLPVGGIGPVHVRRLSTRAVTCAW
jgi:hypothetical protein